MATKRTKPMARTVADWRASPIGKAAITANFELKRIIAAARANRGYHVGTEPGTFVGECWEAGLIAYRDAERAWLAGDDAAAAERVVYIGAMAGMATRDSAKLSKELRSAAGRKSAGVSRPNRRSPLADALRVLIAEGMTNADIIRTLGNADAVSTRAVHGFPIEVCDPETTLEEDGVLRWYKPGGNSDETNECTLAALKKQLSKIRNPPKARRLT